MASPKIELQLVTMFGTKMSEPVYEVTLPTTSGDIAVYPGHEPLVTVIDSGILTVRRNKGDIDEALEFFATNSGVAEISNSKIRILVDQAESSDEIAAEEAEAALERAKEQKSKVESQVELAEAQAVIDRHELRLHVAELKRRHHKTR